MSGEGLSGAEALGSVQHGTAMSQTHTGTHDQVYPVTHDKELFSSKISNEMGISKRQKGGGGGSPIFSEFLVKLVMKISRNS